MATGTDRDDSPIDTIDWEDLDTGWSTIGWRTWGFFLALGVLGVVFVYDRTTGYDLAVGAWYTPSALDWLFVVSLVVFGFVVLAPMARNRGQVVRYWRRFRTNRLAVACLGYLVVFFVVGTASLLVLGRPSTNIRHAKQPPVFFTVEQGTVALRCVGRLTGTPTQQYCHGSLAHPFGTNQVGQDMVELVAAGMGVSLLVALVTSMLMIPIATTVGLVAGYDRGWIDTLLMRYVDIQQAVPAFLVYIVLILQFHASLFLIIVVFGLLSWGGVARLVRSAVIQRREELYVTAAKSAGASRFGVLRRHVLPNVSSTVLTATARQVPALILAEAAIAFLATLGDENVPSWGQFIAIAFEDGYFPSLWWTSVFPLVFLTLTVFSIGVVGDALRDVLDPRGAS